MVWLIGPLTHTVPKYLRRLLMLAECQVTFSKGKQRGRIVWIDAERFFKPRRGVPIASKIHPRERAIVVCLVKQRKLLDRARVCDDCVLELLLFVQAIAFVVRNLGLTDDVVGCKPLIVHI